MNALKNTWFVLPTSIIFVRNPERSYLFLPFDKKRMMKKRMKIISQIDRPFVAQTKVLKRHS